jgi:hypothetical protein
VERDRLLASASSAQLAIGLAGVMVARKRQLAYDLPLLHGRPEKVSRDALWIGTALSAPSPMLVAQGWATVRLLRGAKGPERFVLGGLGVTMTVGYLGETLVRWRLRPSNWDPLESTVASCGVALAVAMAVVACRSLGKPD